MNYLRLSQKQSRILVFSACTITLVALILTQTFHARAEIAFFDALSVEQQIRNAEREGAHVPESLHEYTWSSFTGVVPEGAVVESMVFTLSWIQSTTLENKEDGPEVQNASTSFSEELQINESVEVEMITNGEENTGVHEGLEEPLLDDALHEEEVNTEAQNLAPDVPVQDEVEVEDSAGTAPNEEEEILPSDESVVGFPQVSATTTYFLVNEVSTQSVESSNVDIEKIPAEDVVVTEITEAAVIVTNETLVPTEEGTIQTVGEEGNSYEVLEEVSTPTEVVSEGVTLIEESSASSSVSMIPTRESAELSYSFDGIEWFPTGTVDLLRDAQISFDLGDISIEAIPSLRIRITYSAPLNAEEIRFQKPQLQLSYTEGEVIEESRGPNDQEPNFNVSSVLADVIDSTTRAVFLERGGMYELWIYYTDRSTGLSVWNRLLIGGTISNDMPISVQGRTVFWFDKSTQTLFAYDIDLKSLTGSAPIYPEDTVVMLDFGNNVRMQTVTFDMRMHSFTFSRVLSD